MSLVVTSTFSDIISFEAIGPMGASWGAHGAQEGFPWDSHFVARGRGSGRAEVAIVFARVGSTLGHISCSCYLKLSARDRQGRLEQRWK